MTTATAKKDVFPPQIKYIVGNEACERFSYYGMRAILVGLDIEPALRELDDVLGRTSA